MDATSRPPLPDIYSHSPSTLVYQGAEALVYRTTFLCPPYAHAAFLKHRPSKPYRHPTLDAKLTRHRILSEARALVKLRRAGIDVPAVYALDWDGGVLLGEWIDGESVRSVAESAEATQLGDLMRTVGQVVGKMHEAGVVHGDLTTSNMMVRAGAGAPRVVMIDFGLAAQSVQDEDRAVDLYVLERAFGSTRPDEGLFEEVLKAYQGSFKGAGKVLLRFAEVRMRGRKKIVLG